MRFKTRVLPWLGAVIAGLFTAPSVQAQGLYLPGAGSAHLSMGGVSSATPVDALGALYWNPAAIGRLGHSEVGIGGAVLFPEIGLSSSFPGANGVIRSGNTTSDSGVGLTSNLGWVHEVDDRLTFGLGLNTLAGAGVNYPGDPANPILAPVGPLGRNTGGPIYASLTLVQLAPTIAYKITDRLVFGFGPTVSIALASFNPAYFAPPDDSNGDGLGTFPAATNGHPYWGGGLRAGLVYSVTDKLDIGFGYTSPQWFERWKFNSRNELGVPQSLFLTATLPAIYSWGIAYRPTDKLLLATDLRYFDYKSTDLFGTPIVKGGLGWKSVFAVAVGARYQVTERAAMSVGYVYNDNPIPSVGTLFNVQAPAINQHTFTVGSTMNLTDCVAASLGYAYSFENTLTGPVRESRGVGVSMSSEAHSLLFTIQIKYGGPKKPACPTACLPTSSTATVPVQPSVPAPSLPGPQPGS